MSGLFGNKKKDDKIQGSNATSPASSVAGDADIFGGMAVGAKTRRKRGVTTVDVPIVEHKAPSEAGSDASQVVAAVAPVAEPVNSEPKPFFAKFDYNSDAVEEVEDPADAKLRKRLERFYEEYNPHKLSQVDQTIKAYRGREDELFTALVTKYGPEPSELKKEAVKTASDAPTTEVPAVESPEKPQWDSGDAVSVVDSQWGGAAGGFTFEDNTGGGFQFSEANQDAGGFTFATDTTEPAFGFGDAPTSDTTVGEVTGFGFATAIEPTNADPSDAHQSDSSDDDDEPTLNERHRHELRDAQGDVLEKKNSIIRAVERFRDAARQRQALLRTYTHLEAQIDDCIAREAFERADELNNELQCIGAEIGKLDSTEETCETDLSQCTAKLLIDVKVLANTYVRHRQEILESKGEEERKVNKYIVETSSRLDTQSEKIAASLDRANRTLHNTEQEVMNIEQRHQKIQEKIGEQTKGLRDNLTASIKDKEVLDNEIRDLEQKLQVKRRQSAEKKLAIGELEDKLKIIMDDFADTVNEVTRQLHEETTKRQDAQTVVDDFCQQESSLLKEQKRFSEERDAMLASLSQNNAKIDRYEHVATELSSTVPSTFSDYIGRTVLNVLDARRPAKSFLARNPVSCETTSDSPLGALRELESGLHRLTRDLQEQQATEASLTVRAQDIRKNLPILEAAKKAAAQAKQFKEAQSKTEEIKRITDELQECERGANAALGTASDLKEEIAVVSLKIEKERKNASASVSTFKQTYLRILLEATTKAATPVNILQLEDEDFVRPDDLESALTTLLSALKAELSAIQLDDASPTSVAEEPAPLEDAPETPAESAPTTVEQVIVLSEEEIRNRIVELETQLNDAVEREEFDLCDALQAQIDELQQLEQ